METVVKIVLLVLLALLIIWMIVPYFEGFDVTASEFVPEGAARYGLRGDLLRRRNISGSYINPNRNIRLTNSGGQMWESNTTPCQQGMNGCRKVPCPENDGYDNSDSCWKCGNECRQPFKVPDLWPHVKV